MPLLRELPLSALRSFSVAARTGSITKAAVELGVTPGAVSHQIRQLEDGLGLKLIGRTATGISPTAAAERALPQIEQGFRLLASGLDRLREEKDLQTFTISVDPSFSSFWLAQRIERVREAVSPLNVRIVATVPPEAIVAEGIDLAITYRRGLAPNLEEADLFVERVIPACSPKLAARLPDRDTTDIDDLPLLHIDASMGDDVYPTWPDWFAAAGVSRTELSRGPRFGLSLAAAHAAAADIGVALASEVILASFLASGHLVEIARNGPRLEITRRFVWPENTRRANMTRAAIKALKELSLGNA